MRALGIPRSGTCTQTTLKAVVLAAVLLVAMTGCGRDTKDAASSEPEPTTTSSTIRPSDEELTSTLPVTYQSGQVRFDPPPAGATPKTTPDEVLAAFRKRGLYLEASRYDSSPSVLFASFTHYGNGQMDEHGNLAKLDHVDQLVWVVTYTGVPVAGSGPANMAQAEMEIPLMDVITVVDDATGQDVLTLVDRPDARPAPRHKLP